MRDIPAGSYQTAPNNSSSSPPAPQRDNALPYPTDPLFCQIHFDTGSRCGGGKAQGAWETQIEDHTRAYVHFELISLQLVTLRTAVLSNTTEHRWSRDRYIPSKY